MNDVAWQLLTIKNDTSGQILDAGCGVGGTSIYLAKKYPQMFFTGITIVPSHIVMANKLAKKHNVTSNTRFLEQNYCHTSFPNHSFDGIIALESVIYAHDHEDLITEFYRVLKSGSHLAILDGFRTDKKIPTSMKKIYQIWLDGRALIEVDSVNTFIASMKQKGFQDIRVNDISAHIFSSYVLGIIVDTALFIPTLIKSLASKRNYNPADEFNDFLAFSLATALLVINGYFKYYSVSATK